MTLLILIKTVQIILSILVVILVMLQGHGGGLSGAFGGAISVYRSRRGVERLVVFLTVIFSVLLAVNSLILIGIS